MTGIGYLGLTHAVCMAEIGHDVLALDIDASKIAKATDGVPPGPARQLAELDLETAELVKISANAFLATKVSFINALAEVCEAVGADVADVVLHLTEWSDYQAIDPAVLAKVVHRRFLVDARGALDVGSWRAAGWDVSVLGRS